MVTGHHACCTNAMGPDDDPNSVLDGNFKVRGVDRLRVVDASSWPNVPGFFITTPTYMMSEKAADVIIAAAKARA
ncbi:glucose-methanol-choline oxidoreductase, partial [Lyophyllum atratum]